MTFTSQIARYILDSEIDLEHLVIVLPSERAKKYIAGALFEENGKAMISPKMITIDQWISNCSTKTIIDKTRALIALFNAHNSDKKNIEPISFDEFITWGTILLSDYDDIDRYLLSSKEVFKNLADIKELEAWNIDEKEYSENQKRFLVFWEKLPQLYSDFKDVLEAKKSAFAGSAYQEVATNIDLVFKEDKKRHFLFAGFNALSKAEITIMKQLSTMGRATVLIDADSYYLDNKNHEAGHFLRQLKAELGGAPLQFVGNSIANDRKKIDVVECAQTTGQVKVATTRLLELSEEEIKETLILLADESLIIPLLKNLPRKVGKANITLGMPLKYSSLRNWVDLILSIQEAKLRFNTDAIYFTDLQQFLNHPFIIACSSDEALKKSYDLEQSIIRNNRVFINVKSCDLGAEIQTILETITSAWKNNWPYALGKIRSNSKQIFQLLPAESQFEKALLEGFDKSLIDFENIISEGLPTLELKTFKALFNQHWRGKSIAYHGNPIDGLQIMGLLETRLLDFKRIICLGLNEGNLPPTNPIQTMIPMDLRRFLGLPTPREKQGLFAHHFYRLLHHCEELLVTFTSSSEAIGSNEQSRYLLQLELELCRKNKNIEFERSFYTIPMEDENTSNSKSVVKTPEIIERLGKVFAKSTSASKLKNYVTCPLDFYYKYVLEFGEEDMVEEEVESNTFGTLIHETLEELFTPFVRSIDADSKAPVLAKQVTSRDIDTMIATFERILASKFTAHFGGDKEIFASGKNLLSFQMACSLTKKFLQQQKKLIQSQNTLFIESLEVKLAHDLTLNIHGKDYLIHLNGVIDRIDTLNGKVRIIDYKSGDVNASDVTINCSKDGELLEKTIKPKYTLQLLIYSYLYKMTYGKLPDEVGIYSFVKVKSDLFSLELKGKTLEEAVDEFPEMLTEFLELAFDEETPFEHDSSQFFSYCSYCV